MLNTTARKDIVIGYIRIKSCIMAVQSHGKVGQLILRDMHS